MLFLKTSDEALLGVIPFDAEHMREIAMVNLIHASIEAGVREATLRNLVQGLLRQTQCRFAQEHLLMKRVAYPAADRHRRSHHEIIHTLEQMWTDADLAGNSAADAARRVIEDGASLIREHMQAEDRPLAGYLESRPRVVRPATTSRRAPHRR